MQPEPQRKAVSQLLTVVVILTFHKFTQGFLFLFEDSTSLISQLITLVSSIYLVQLGFSLFVFITLAFVLPVQFYL